MRENRLTFRKTYARTPYQGSGSSPARGRYCPGDRGNLGPGVTEALRERFERLPSRVCKASVEELRAIAQRASGSVKEGYLDHAEFLYE